MSNAQQAYVRTLFDDARSQLEGAIQSGAKWPAALAVKPTVDEYKGYTNSFVRFVVRTNIEGDRNNGIIEVKVPVQDWYKIGALIDNLTGEDVKLPAIDSYEKPFGRDKKPSKEPVRMAIFKLLAADPQWPSAAVSASSMVNIMYGQVANSFRLNKG